MTARWRAPSLAAIVLALVLAAANAAFGDPAQETSLPADGVQSIEQTATGEWTATFDAAPFEVKVIGNPQLIVCGTNYGHPCSTSELFTWAHGDCLYAQIDWAGQHNSSDPYVCRPVVVPSASPTASLPVPTTTSTPEPTATLPTPAQTPTEVPSSTPLPTPTSTEAATSTATATPHATSAPVDLSAPITSSSPTPTTPTTPRLGPAPTLTPTPPAQVSAPTDGTTQLAATGTWTVAQYFAVGLMALVIIVSGFALIGLGRQDAPRYKRGGK